MIGPLTNTKRSPVLKLVRPPFSSLALVYLMLDIGTRPLLVRKASISLLETDRGRSFIRVGFCQIIVLVVPSK